MWYLADGIYCELPVVGTSSQLDTLMGGASLNEAQACRGGIPTLYTDTRRYNDRILRARVKLHLPSLDR